MSLVISNVYKRFYYWKLEKGRKKKFQFLLLAGFEPGKWRFFVFNVESRWSVGNTKWPPLITTIFPFSRQNIFFNQKNHVIDKIFHCFCFVPNEWDSFHQMARIEANVLICLVVQAKKSSASSKKHKSQRLQSWFVHICAERNIRTTTLRYCHLLLYLRWLLPKFFYDTLGG